MKDDRRISHRHSIDILINAFHNGLPTLCLGFDVSEWGIGLRALQDVQATVASFLDLEFQLPGTGRVISVRGEVRRRSSGQLGLFFQRISDSDRAQIREFVSA
jgi:hypothetical protein